MKLRSNPPTTLVSCGGPKNARADTEESAVEEPRADVPPPYRPLAVEHAAATAAYHPKAWLRFEVDGDNLIVETSWLPDLPASGPSQVISHLRRLPSEFKRQDNGSYVARVRIDDDLKVERVAAQALHTILGELRRISDVGED